LLKLWTFNGDWFFVERESGEKWWQKGVQIEALVVERWNPVIEWPENNPSG